MARFVRCALASLLVFLTGNVSGATPEATALASPDTIASPRRMTLQEAIEYAHAHHPAVLASLARVTATQADAKIPRAQWYPVLGASAQIFAGSANNTTASYVGARQFDVPRIGGTRVVSQGSWAPYASTFVGLGARQEVFEFGRIAAESAALDTLIDVEKQRERKDELDVTFDIEEAYFAVFSAKAIRTASEDAYERAKAHRDLAKAGVNSGLRSPIDLTRAEADLTRFDIARTKAIGGIASAQAVLAAAVGVPDAALDIAEAPPAPNEIPSLAAAIQRGAARDPAILQALAELRAAEAATRAIGSELRPDLAATATLTGRAGGGVPSGNGSPAQGSGWLPDVPNWDVGLVFNLPLFDGSIVARRDAAKAREKVRAEEVQLATERELAAIREAYVAADVARTTLPGLTRAVAAARANYAQAEARFGAGLGTSVELADAEAIRTDAEIQLALGQFELARARAALGRTIAEGI